MLAAFKSTPSRFVTRITDFCRFIGMCSFATWLQLHHLGIADTNEFHQFDLNEHPLAIHLLAFQNSSK
ncbi:hypothetical protein A6J66_022375 [Yersinia enterocolitica]|nr:hypothetical protein A6J66_022375 [Yersinia enterocolitica]